jgi:hypothetical protein
MSRVFLALSLTKGLAMMGMDSEAGMRPLGLLKKPGADIFCIIDLVISRCILEWREARIYLDRSTKIEESCCGICSHTRASTGPDNL